MYVMKLATYFLTVVKLNVTFRIIAQFLAFSTDCGRLRSSKGFRTGEWCFWKHNILNNAKMSAE